MHRPIPAVLLLGAVVIVAPLFQPHTARAQTAVERARRQLDEQIERDRFLDAAKDARGDVRPGGPAGIDDLDADRAPTVTSRGLQENSSTRQGSSQVTPIPSLGDNVQR